MGRAPQSAWAVDNSTINFHSLGRQDWEDCTYESSQIECTAARLLRLVLANNQPIIHLDLKHKALAGIESDTSKCIVDMALFSLLEQGLLTRHGHGNWALYSVPDECTHDATQLAYAEFPCEDSSAYQHPRMQHQQPLAAFPSLPATSPCSFAASLRRPGSPHLRGARRGSSERMSALHRVRFTGKRGNSSSNLSNEDIPISAKRARMNRPPSTLSGGPAPMSP